MENPFEIIIRKLDQIEKRLAQLESNNVNLQEESYLKIDAAAAFLSSTRGALQIMTSLKTIPHKKKWVSYISESQI